MEDWVSNRLDTEPSIFRGCSLSELTVLIAVALLICVPVSLILLWFIGYPMMGVGLGVVLAIIVVLIGGRMLQRLKRGRPLRFYQTQVLLILKHIGFKKIVVIQHSTVWRLGRVSALPHKKT